MRTHAANALRSIQTGLPGISAWQACPVETGSTTKAVIKKMYLLAIAACVTLMAAGCDRTSDKEMIERKMDAMSEAVERKEFSAIQEHLHASFSANDHLDATAVKHLLRMHGSRHRNIGVSVLASKTAMNPAHPDRATTKASVVVTGSSGLLPSDGSVRVVTIEWVKQSDDWFVIRARW